MNNNTKIIAATLLAAASSVSFAETEIYTTFNNAVVKVGDKFEQGHERSRKVGLPFSSEFLKGNRFVIQFNVRSTNKSRYNAMYLEHAIDEIDNVPPGFREACDPDKYTSNEDFVGGLHFFDSDNPILVTNLPYSPHKETHNNEEWDNGWRSVHKVVHVPDSFIGENRYLALRVCSRDKDGGVDGDLDDFEIKDIVIHYETEEENLPFNTRE